MTPVFPDPFREIPGIRRHWNRVVLMSPETMQRLLAVSDELACVYAILNRSCDSDGFATIAPREIATRMMQPVRKVLEWIGTLVELQIVNVGIAADGARLLIAEWDERAYEAMIREGDCRE